MGVWIEENCPSDVNLIDVVTPCVGVWIEEKELQKLQGISAVTPCVGVWIEIKKIAQAIAGKLSLPVWECGLKFSSPKRLNLHL